MKCISRNQIRINAYEKMRVPNKVGMNNMMGMTKDNTFCKR